MTATYTHGKFVWFEHMSPEIDTARAFYEALFGWRSNVVPMGTDSYPMIQHGEQGIGGYRKATGKAPTHWIAYLSVPDVDASFKAIAAQGCRTMLAPTDIGPGRMAAVADPTGASFALWKGADGDNPDRPSRVGEWHWTELWTTDEKKAVEFYQATFGYSVDTMAMPTGTYYILKKDGVPRAGLMRSSEPKAHSMWLSYVSVEDCDATLRKAESLGAKVVVPSIDMPQVGRFAVLVDPVGAAIGVIQVPH